MIAPPTASVRHHDTRETFCTPAMRRLSVTGTSTGLIPKRTATTCASMVQP
jgi:hypothetical protein